MKPVAVIGLGKFGFYIAKSLAKLNIEIIAVDSDMEKVQQMAQFTDNAFALNSTSKVALEEVGVYNLETVIVSIGENIEASILTVMALKDLNNKTIIAKAINSTHGEILTKIGAFKVIYPEKIAGRMLVKKLIDNMTVEEIDVSNTIKMVKFVATDDFIYKKISEIESEFKNLKIISYKTGGIWSMQIDPFYQVKKDDLLVFLGESKYIKEFYKQI